MKMKFVKVFLRASIALGFLSAVADRFGFWPFTVSAWGNWDSFTAYTKTLNPWVPDSVIPLLAGVVTLAEIVLALFLIMGFKTSLVAKLSGFLLLTFAFAMAQTIGIKAPLDYSVLTASAAAFGLSSIKEKYLELDSLFERN